MSSNPYLPPSPRQPASPYTAPATPKGAGYAPAASEAWQKGSNDKATTAIWMAVIGLFLFPPLELVAFGFALKALKLANRRGGDGRGKAIFAVALSSFFVFMFTLLLLNLIATNGSGSGSQGGF